MMYLASNYTVMQLQKKVTKLAKVHPSDYVNHTTGENMASEHNKKISVTMREDTGHFTVNSDNYVVFDQGAMEYVQGAIAKVDVGKVFKMSTMLKGDCSVLYQNNNHPHNANTLPVILDMSQDKFYNLVRRLVSKGILAYAVCAPSGFTQKIYMLNPYIVRKKKTFNNELMVWFSDVSKPIPIHEKKSQSIPESITPKTEV